MGLFVRQTSDRSELQSKIIADLQQRAKESSGNEGEKIPEPAFLENQHETRIAGVVIGLLVITLIVTIIFIVINSR